MTIEQPPERPGYKLVAVVKYIKRKNGTIQLPPPGKKGIPIWRRIDAKERVA